MTLDLNQSMTIVLVTRAGMGDAPENLQLKLAATYFRLLAESEMLPGAICFYAEGVKLVCSGSPVLDWLRMLADKGVQLIICNTCLDFYGLKEQVEVGIVGGMTDIIEAQWRAEKVIAI